MTDEYEIYDKFVDVLNERLENEPSTKDLAVVLDFLKYNNIQASKRHKGVNQLTNKVQDLLPFDDEEDDEQPPQKPNLRRIK